MATVDEKEDGSLSSIFTDYMVSLQNGNEPSAEDIAWVESCLVEDPETSDVDWSSVKDVLFEILNLQQEHQSSSARENVDSSRGMDIDLTDSDKVGMPQTYEGSNGDLVSPNQITETETKTDPFVPKEENDDLSRQFFWGDDSSEMSLHDDMLSDDKKNDQKTSEVNSSASEDTLLSEIAKLCPSEPYKKCVFLPTYKEENSRPSLAVDSGFDDLDSFVFDLEPTSDDLFKVWDLEQRQSIPFDDVDDLTLDNDTEPSTDHLFKLWDLESPAEEGELMRQLNKAVSFGTVRGTRSNLSNPPFAKDLKEESVDELITGIADLALVQNSSFL